MIDTLSYLFNRLVFIGADLGIPGVEVPGEVAAPPAAGAANGAAAIAGEAAQAAAPPDAGMGLLPMLLIWGAVFVGMYFLMIRPQRKRDKKMKEMQAAITLGDEVVTAGGFFGKVADVGEDVFVVEFGTNRGVRIPVLKSDVVAVRSPKMTPPPKDVVET